MAPDPDASFARVWLAARYVLRPLGQVALRPMVTGRERIPARGGAVIACTHVGYLDALLVTQVLLRPTRFMAAAGVFRIPIVGTILRAAGCFAVRRGERDTASVRQAIEIARGGGLVGIFPQGGLKHGTGLDDLHRGAAMIALRAGVPIVPVGIGHGPSFVRVGEPLAPEGDARTLTARLGAALAALVSPR